jgi:LPS sulfotransferase NodH
MTRDAFDQFVILADMRTGSNLLEEKLNAYPGLRCHGEVFNPHFVGHAGERSLFGLSLEDRDRDPRQMVRRLAERTEGLGGFRLFPGHAPRVLDLCLADPRCAKIVLARNPADSYVSLKIARQTGQWWMGNHVGARTARVRFDAAEFDGFLRGLQAFYGQIRRSLQHSGQTAFHIHYDDLGEAEVLDGLARWLGAGGGAAAGRSRARVQNPEPLEDKVENFAEMAAALGQADAFDLYRVPDFEPRRGPNVPAWMASDPLRLLFVPLPGGPTDRVGGWLEAAGGEPPASGWSQKALRRWQRDTPGHRSFTVVTHPLRRAHDAFCTRILVTGPDAFGEIRSLLRDRHGLDLPEEGPQPDGQADWQADWGTERHRAAFLGFLRFLKANLGGQTSVRVPAVWSSQSSLLRAAAEILVPDAILRSETLARDLDRLKPGVPVPPDVEPGPVPLAAIYDAEIEEAARAACARDYAAFGYGPWR